MDTSTLAAVVQWGNDWHGGAASRPYRMMCRAARLLARRGYGAGGYAACDKPLGRRARAIYKRLEARSKAGRD